MKLKRIRWKKSSGSYFAMVGPFRLVVMLAPGSDFAWQWRVIHEMDRLATSDNWFREPRDAKRACRRWLTNLAKACAEIQEGNDGE